VPFHYLSELPIFLGAVIYIGIIMLIALSGALLFHRYVPRAVLEAHNDIAGFVFAVVGVVYAVLLAFIAIAVWENFGAAEQHTYEEAARLTVVYRKSDLFPQVHALRAELKRYVQTIVDREWNEMYYGKHDAQAEASAERIANQIRHLQVRTPAQQNVHAAMMDSMDQALVDRDFRTGAASIGVNAFLWFIMFVGAAATIVFAYFFAYNNRWALIAIVGMLAFMLGLVLYLTAAVDYPFRGAIHVGPEAFENALHHFERIGP
jgi:ABC-type multidrug transport system fused ATPase/permease subunit